MYNSSKCTTQTLYYNDMAMWHSPSPPHPLPPPPPFVLSPHHPPLPPSPCLPPTPRPSPPGQGAWGSIINSRRLSITAQPEISCYVEARPRGSWVRDAPCVCLTIGSARRGGTLVAPGRAVTQSFEFVFYILLSSIKQWILQSFCLRVLFFCYF